MFKQFLEALQVAPCCLEPIKEEFERNMKPAEGALIRFDGVDGNDVYNCSIPFTYKGKTYIYGRVEKRDEWVQSHTALFERVGDDHFRRVPDSRSFDLEDPFVVKIKGEMVFGGTQVTKNGGKVSDYRCAFYRGTPDDLKYFTSGPGTMKDVRLIELADGRVGVFSHFRTEGSCLTGFAVVEKVSDVSEEVVNGAKLIDHRIFGDAWGGPNQVYLLSSGMLGCIGHHGYLQHRKDELQLRIYCCTSYVLDPNTLKVYDFKVIATKKSFPDCPAKLPRLVECAFVSGITMRPDGKCDLYSGLGDTSEGRIVIDYPFEGHGSIVSDLDF